MKNMAIGGYMTSTPGLEYNQFLTIRQNLEKNRNTQIFYRDLEKNRETKNFSQKLREKRGTRTFN